MTEQRPTEDLLAGTATERVQDDQERQRQLVAELEWIEAHYSEALREMRNR